MKCISCPKSTKIDAFGQKICKCHSPIDYVSFQGKQGGAMASLKSKIRKTNERIILAASIYMQDWQLTPNASAIVSIISYSINSKFQLIKEFKY